MPPDPEQNHDQKPDDRIFVEDYIPLPTDLYSDETSEPFCRCVECDKELLHPHEVYVIQKAYQGDKTIVEIAWCAECHDRARESYSKETLTRINDFMLDHGELGARQKRLKSEHRCDFPKWIESCLTCRKIPGSNESKLVIATAQDHDLLFHFAPYMLCEDCQDQIIELFSTQSRDSWENWKEQHLPGPPAETQSLPDTRTLVLL